MEDATSTVIGTGTSTAPPSSNHDTSNNNDKSQRKGEEGDSLVTDDVEVGPLVESGITCSDLETTLRVLRAIAAFRHAGKTETPSSPVKNPSSSDHNNHNTDHDNHNEDGLSRYRHKSLRPVRKVLSEIYEHLHQRLLYGNVSEEEYYRIRREQRTLQRQKLSETKQQQSYVDRAGLRKRRLENLERLKEAGEDEERAKHARWMIPDGPGAKLELPQQQQQQLLEQQQQPFEPQQQLLQQQQPQQQQQQVEPEPKTDPIDLPKLRSCYVCKTRFRRLHHFYDQLCPSCAALNWNKRHASLDLEGRVAVVTGGRIKIGFQTSLKLLRARAAAVIVTTRFPNTAAASFASEPDFTEWAHRLHLYGLDLRDVVGVEAFAAFVRHKFRTVHILINNACQTVRRPVGYYKTLVDDEQALWQSFQPSSSLPSSSSLSSSSSPKWDQLTCLHGCLEFETFRDRHYGTSSAPVKDHNSTTTPTGTVPTLCDTDNHSINNNHSNHGAVVSLSVPPANDQGTVAKALASSLSSVRGGGQPPTTTYETTGLSHSARLSQTVLLDEDLTNPSSSSSSPILSTTVRDVNRNALDLRQTNSWVLKLEQVSTPEIMETMVINAVSPFVLNSRLIPLMMDHNDSDQPSSSSAPSSSPPRYIVNVSAMEGKFYRYKMPNHPHTNMAKAALNMMTRTSAADLASRHHIYMNSVDTGWINDENPLHRAHRIFERNQFQTPIDEIDAAARILDPVFSDSRDSGKFYKDYRETEW